jgi:hypothetical protein
MLLSCKDLTRFFQLVETKKSDEKKEAEASLWDSFLKAPSEAYDMVFDPNKKEREEEERLRKEVKASKKAWRKIRQERFAFLDSAATSGGASTAKSSNASKSEEKKE